MQPNPTSVLLNLKPDSLSGTQIKFFLQLLTAAKQTLAKAWKFLSLVVAEAKHRVNRTMTHAKMEAIEKDQVSKFNKIWQPWVTHCLPPTFDQSVLLSR